jgi:RNA polymerase sigma-70 factor (ECF subfamily)
VWAALSGSLRMEGVGVRNSEEFDEFYLGSLRRVSGYVFALTGDRAETEDLVQEAFSRAWQRWDRTRELTDPEAWVRTVAYRLRVSRWRRVTAGVRAHRRHGAPQDVPELSVDYVALITALRAISFQQRRAIVLHYLVGLSVEEIADETGVAIGTVKSRLSRARTALAGLLGESESESADRNTKPNSLPKEAHVHA